uniref:Uncharacterized protein n=1 Tax=Parascaris equorum TaxID=6256 RepID=A0A914RMS7_PAREQ
MPAEVPPESTVIEEKPPEVAEEAKEQEVEAKARLIFLCGDVQSEFEERTLRSFEEHEKRRECHQLEKGEVGRGLWATTLDAIFLNVHIELEYLIFGVASFLD